MAESASILPILDADAYEGEGKDDFLCGKGEHDVICSKGEHDVIRSKVLSKRNRQDWWEHMVFLHGQHCVKGNLKVH